MRLLRNLFIGTAGRHGNSCIDPGSHFHADHVGGLKDFDSAVIHCSREACLKVLQAGRYGGFARGILKSLIPGNIGQRVRLVEECGRPFNDRVFGMVYDLFGDGSLIVVPLPGHAAGQIGLRFQTSERAWFLISDAAFTMQSVRTLTMPGHAARLITRSWKEYRGILKKLHAFHLANPDVEMVPSHCLETYQRLVRSNT